MPVTFPVASYVNVVVLPVAFVTLVRLLFASYVNDVVAPCASTVRTRRRPPSCACWVTLPRGSVIEVMPATGDSYANDVVNARPFVCTTTRPRASYTFRRNTTPRASLAAVIR